MTATKPLVAIVGRPNVGKSMLFNRLAGSRRAITADEAGTTRDRLYADAEWNGSTFTLIDTGGLTNDSDGMATAINQQVREAITEADLLVLLVDATAGLTAEDKAVAEAVRRSGKPAIVAVNKVDDAPDRANQEFWELGFDSVQPISAIHGKGTGDLSDVIVEKAQSSTEEAEPATHPVVTIVGRPNAGKSTLFNKLAGGDQRIIGDEPGTTRDVGSIEVEGPEGPIALLDTAGMPKAKRTRVGIPKFSLLRTLRAINQSDVVVLLIDAVEGPSVQDAHIAEYVMEAGRGIVIAVNKWDAIERSDDIQERFHGQLQERLGWLPSPPVVFLSALTGEKVDRLLRAVIDVYQIAGTKLSTGKLNRFVQDRMDRLPASSRKARTSPKLYYLTQTGVHPPTFAVFVNDPAAWSDIQQRWLAGQLRDEFGLLGTAVHLNLRPRRKDNRPSAKTSESA
ncbi:ribosome biogenesis GTPase Der [Patescibacteria group bacterium]|nr:ribosome biogenesis GTPase Der [Patescibacteria group bacterium]